MAKAKKVEQAEPKENAVLGHPGYITELFIGRRERFVEADLPQVPLAKLTMSRKPMMQRTYRRSGRSLQGGEADSRCASAV
jgi:hypothetical protein